MIRDLVYLYDDVASSKKLERTILELEQTITQKNLGGNVAKQDTFREMRHMVAEQVRNGAKTLVFVGSEKSVLDGLMELSSSEVIIGFIPLTPSLFAQTLGIPVGVEALTILSARFVMPFDMGVVNNTLFFNDIALPSTQAKITLDKKYTVQPTQLGAISIRNTGQFRPNVQELGNPFDEKLELIIQTTRQSFPRWQFWKKPVIEETRLFFQQGTLESAEEMEVFVDGRVMQGKRFEIGIKPKALRLIIGRNAKILER